MELSVNEFHLATMVAVIVTVSIATHLFVIGASGPAASGFFAGLRSRFGGAPRRVKDFFDDRVASMLARRERQAAIGRAGGERLR
jgi:hypothetical protein